MLLRNKKELTEGEKLPKVMVWLDVEVTGWSALCLYPHYGEACGSLSDVILSKTQ